MLPKLRFYLASIAGRWTPNIAVVRQAGEISGFMLMKEKTIASIRTGVLFADAAGGGDFIIARPGQNEQVLNLALNFHFNAGKIRGIRLFAPIEGAEAQIATHVAQINNFVVQSTPREYHTELPLAESYDEFRRTVISKKMKENINLYANRITREGHTFHHSIPFDEFQTVALDMVKRQQVRKDLPTIQRGLKMIEHAAQPILVGLRHANGQEWLSLIMGWQQGNKAWLYAQLNREFDFPKNSLGIATLGHAIPHFIQTGKAQSVIFWGGRTGPLGRACTALPNDIIYLDSKVFRHQAKWLAKAATLVSPIMPRQIQRSIKHSVTGILAPKT